MSLSMFWKPPLLPKTTITINLQRQYYSILNWPRKIENCCNNLKSFHGLSQMTANHSQKAGCSDEYIDKSPLGYESDAAGKHASNTPPGPKRYLAAFDFDHTVVDQNTDTVCRDMLLADKRGALRQRLDSIAQTEGWTEHMAAVFRELHQRQIAPERLLDRIRQLPEVKGMNKLLRTLHDQHNCDLIIISDSNSVFIDAWLQSQHLTDPPYFRRIFTNPAHFDAEGLLHISPFHCQIECKLSARNLCKGRVLEEFISEETKEQQPPLPSAEAKSIMRSYHRIFYIGDGQNDICPVLRLQSQDIACARRDYTLAATLTNTRSSSKIIFQKPKAHILLWKDGYDLLHQLEKYIRSDSESGKEAVHADKKYGD